MLEVTETAKNQLHRSLATADHPEPEGTCFRIIPKDKKFLTLKLVKPAPGDTVFTHDGETILALPKVLQPFFQDKCLDIDKSGRVAISGAKLNE